MCDKVQYETYKLAKDAMISVSQRVKEKYKVYKCSECLHFHLTTIKPRTKPSLPKGLELLNHDADIKKLRKQVENGAINPPKLKPKPSEGKHIKHYKATATFTLGDLYPNLRTPKKKQG